MRLHACPSPFSKFLYTTVNLRTLASVRTVRVTCSRKGIAAHAWAEVCTLHIVHGGLLILDQADSQRLTEALSFFLDR